MGKGYLSVGNVSKNVEQGRTQDFISGGAGWMASAGARAYNGGLGAVPPAGSRDRTNGGPGAEPLVGGQGAKPL